MSLGKWLSRVAGKFGLNQTISVTATKWSKKRKPLKRRPPDAGNQSRTVTLPWWLVTQIEDVAEFNRESFSESVERLLVYGKALNPTPVKPPRLPLMDMEEVNGEPAPGAQTLTVGDWSRPNHENS